MVEIMHCFNFFSSYLKVIIFHTVNEWKYLITDEDDTNENVNDKDAILNCCLKLIERGNCVVSDLKFYLYR